MTINELREQIARKWLAEQLKTLRTDAEVETLTGEAWKHAGAAIAANAERQQRQSQIVERTFARLKRGTA